jgi:hypothetical protein
MSFTTMPTAMPSTTLLRLARRAALAAALLAPAAWAAPFTDHGDSTVTDAATGLMWDQCPLDRSGANCTTGTVFSGNWQAALAAVHTANQNARHGYSDWRLPNVKELRSLVDKSKPGPGQVGLVPSIDTTAFPGTPAAGFWSSTTYTPDSAVAWFVHFSYGDTSYFYKTNTYYVRLVRSGQSFAFFDSSDTLAPQATASTVTPGNTGTTASASVKSSEAGTGYWLVQPPGSPPDAATLESTGQPVTLAANVALPIAPAGLSQGTAYVLYFTAKDGAGNLQASVASQPFTTAGAPGAPTGVAATPGAAGSGTVDVSWTPPADNGGSAITHYTVSPNPHSVACAASPCVITGLANAAQHSFTVTATNGVDTGAASNPSPAVWLQGTQAITFPPQTDASRSFTPGGTFAIAPTASIDSGQPLTYGSQNAGVCTVAGTTVTMAGAGACVLTASQPGSAAWAAATTATQTVTIGLGANAITVPAQAARTFSAGGTFAISPAASGLSSAPVTYASQSPAVCTVAGSTVTMVSAGTCTLAASQAADANWSAAGPQTQTVAIQATAPGAPTGVQATPAGTGAATVSWTPPANDGGGITQYTVTALVNGQPSGQGCTATPPATSCTVTGLQDGVTYAFSVQAENGAGSAAAPAPSNPATPLADAKAFSALSPTGSGTVGVAVAGGGATCAFESVQMLSAATAGAPATRSFPHGVLDFVLHACDATPVTVTITYPPGTPLQGAQYWKRQGGTWGPFAAALGANTAVLTLTDGGAGDDDGVAVPNGRIVDPGGVSVLAAPGPGGAAAIPALSPWGLAALAAALGLLGWRRRQ